jgi:glyoxylase-like metal-dependent hydrolase (beta-lactamase superfamily II)
VTSSLQHDVFVTSQIPQSGREPLPDGSTRMWSPITSTLIMGEHDAVLVDPPMTKAQAAAVGDWISSSGRKLRQIYITHGHGDHWFGAIPLLQRFPGVAVRATKGTTERARRTGHRRVHARPTHLRGAAPPSRHDSHPPALLG